MKLVATIHLFFLLSCLQSFAHEGHQAFYKLTVENGAFVLTSKLEIPDLQTVFEQTELCASDQDFNWCAGAWLAENVSISVDGTAHTLTLESSVTEDGHLIFTHSLGLAPAKMVFIAVENTAFLSAFSDYENIFQSSLGNSPNGYKMTNERTTITINLDQ